MYITHICRYTYIYIYLLLLGPWITCFYCHPDSVSSVALSVPLMAGQGCRIEGRCWTDVGAIATY